MKRPDAARKQNRRLLIMGILLLAVGTIWTAVQMHALFTWERTTAKVLSVKAIDSGSGSNRSRTYMPRLEFTDHSGRTRVVSPGYSSAQFEFDRGEQVPVIFKRDDPTHFRITTFTSYWIWPLVALAFGGVVVVLSVRSQPEVETPAAGQGAP